MLTCVFLLPRPMITFCTPIVGLICQISTSLTPSLSYFGVTQAFDFIPSLIILIIVHFFFPQRILMFLFISPPRQACSFPFLLLVISPSMEGLIALLIFIFHDFNHLHFTRLPNFTSSSSVHLPYLHLSVHSSYLHLVFNLLHHKSVSFMP